MSRPFQKGHLAYDGDGPGSLDELASFWKPDKYPALCYLRRVSERGEPLQAPYYKEAIDRLERGLPPLPPR